MANTRVSDLTAGGVITNTDLFYAVETAGVGGVSKTGAQLAEFTRDTIGAALVGGTNISVVLDDGADTITINFTGTIPTDEDIQDAVGAAFDGTTLVYIDALNSFIRGALTGDVLSSAGSSDTVIADEAVTNAQLAHVATDTIKGRTTAGTGDPEDLTPAQAREVIAVRELITANRTYYVRTDGSDSNDGLTDNSGGAFLTINKAIETVAAIDMGGFKAFINVGAGTYAERLILKSLVGGSCTITGDTTTPSNVIIAPSHDCISGFTPFNGDYIIRGFRLNPGTGRIGITTASPNGTISINNIEFNTTTAAHLQATAGSLITITGDCEIIGGASRHINAQGGAAIAYSGTITVTLTGTPAFSAEFCLVKSTGVATISSSGVTFSGSATGQRYDGESNGVINTLGGGATFLPGNSAGATATGAQYV